MTCGNDTTRFILDGQSVVQEELNGNTNATYLLGPRGIEYRRSADEVTRWYIYDGLGSVLGEVNEDGEIVDANDNPVPLKRYDAYGAELTNIAGTTDHKFVGSLGHTTDSNTGLIYMQARYYDPTLGRFISEDPAGDGANWYVYCENNPVSRVDPNGEFFVDASIFAAGLITLGFMCIAAAAVGPNLTAAVADFVAANAALRTLWSFVKFGVDVNMGIAGAGPVKAYVIAIVSAVQVFAEMGMLTAFGGVAARAGLAMGGMALVVYGILLEMEV